VLARTADGEAVRVARTSSPRLVIPSLAMDGPEPPRVLGVMSGRAFAQSGFEGRFAGLRIRGPWYRASRELLDFVGREARPIRPDQKIVRRPRETAQGRHYRVHLRLRGRNGGPDREREVHKDTPRLDPGMVRTLRAYPHRASVLISLCWLSNEDCPKYRQRPPPEAQDRAPSPA